MEEVSGGRCEGLWGWGLVCRVHFALTTKPEVGEYKDDNARYIWRETGQWSNWRRWYFDQFKKEISENGPKNQNPEPPWVIWSHFTPSSIQLGTSMCLIIFPHCDANIQMRFCIQKKDFGMKSRGKNCGNGIVVSKLFKDGTYFHIG